MIKLDSLRGAGHCASIEEIVIREEEEWDGEKKRGVLVRNLM